MSNQTCSRCEITFKRPDDAGIPADRCEQCADTVHVRSANDAVNHPDHYQSGDGIECIDAIRAALGLEGFVAHCRGTAIKYAWRAGKKAEHAEDLRKGAWYLMRAAESLEGEK